MIVNESTRFQEKQLITKLDNGLTVIIVSKPGFRSNSAVLGTSFGAKNLAQAVGDQKQIYHAGLAHFLEHKLFEQEEEDILSVFTNIGASANAFTSYNETVYYFNNVDDIVQPLNILLDFVMSLSISQESVEKEKGIIIEELKMYQQIPGFQLTMELFKSMFFEHALNQDIAGSVESVNAITKDELMLAYQTNYHPSQMVLSIVTHKDPQEVLAIISENQSRKTFTQLRDVTPIYVNEPKDVVTPYKELKMNVTTPKLAVGYKQLRSFNNYAEIAKTNLMSRFLLEMTFSNLNPSYQEFLDKGIINDFFNFQVDYGFDYGFIQFVAETNDSQGFIEFLEEQLADLTIDETLLTQLKRRTMGENIADMQDFESFAIDGLRAHFMDINYFDLVTMAETVTVDDLQAVKEQIDLTHRAIVKIDQ